LVPAAIRNRRNWALPAAAVIISVGSVSPAGAVTLGFYDYIPGWRSSPYYARPYRSPATRPKTATAKPNIAANELAEKAKGPLQIFISLDKQQLTLYAGDTVIGHSRISSGQAGHSTPTGIFSIIQKDRWHRSNIYEDAPMYFMQRITWSGVALHQGIVPNHPASHGCIRLPEAFAQKLWGITRLGVRVVVSHKEVAPVEFAHSKLFVPKREPNLASLSSLEAARYAWKIAQLPAAAPIAGATASDFSQPSEPAPEAPKATPAPKRSHVAVFISRKEGKVFVRQNFEPLFDAAIEIADPQQPLGTHVFTAVGDKVGGTDLRWSVASVIPTTAAASALDRISIPQDAIDRISELVGPGSSLIISDQGLGPETGKGTDFIVLTR
jgi:lipoprotein-anchoring transpeptidase ErfK/SrfK